MNKILIFLGIISIIGNTLGIICLEKGDPMYYVYASLLGLSSYIVTDVFLRIYEERHP